MAKAEDSKLHGAVALTERLGSETVVELTLADGSKIIGALSEDMILETGTAVTFNFDRTQAHLFKDTA